MSQTKTVLSIHLSPVNFHPSILSFVSIVSSLPLLLNLYPFFPSLDWIPPFISNPSSFLCLSLFLPISLPFTTLFHLPLSFHLSPSSPPFLPCLPLPVFLSPSRWSFNTSSGRREADEACGWRVQMFTHPWSCLYRTHSSILLSSHRDANFEPFVMYIFKMKSIKKSCNMT